MGPLVYLGIGAAGLLGYKLFKKEEPKLQSLRRISSNGIPVQVVVPVDPDAPAPHPNKSDTPTHPTIVLSQMAIPLPAQPAVVPSVPPPVQQPSVPTFSVPSNPPVIITPSGNSTLHVVTDSDVQRALNTLGVASPKLDVDGKIGPLSVAAIKKYQGLKNFAQTGAADDNTKKALEADLANFAATGKQLANPSAVSDYYAAHPVLSGKVANMANLPGGDVSTIITPESSNKDVQHALNILGASPALVEDGKIGPKSIAAIKAFQIVHGMAATGMLDYKTKMSIGLALAPQTSLNGEFGGDSEVGCTGSIG